MCLRRSQSSLATTKGEHTSCLFRRDSPHVVVSSVMSGIITGPYFIQYFHRPLPHEVGTMVAVLEIGAFGTS